MINTTIIVMKMAINNATDITTAIIIVAVLFGEAVAKARGSNFFSDCSYCLPVEIAIE